MIELILSQRQLEAIIDHTRCPDEVCGLIGGAARWQAGQCSALARTVLPVPNIAPDPRYFFTMSPQDMVKVMMRFRRTGDEVVGVYHSHPASEPVPSASDVAEATWPEAAYLIVGYAVSSPQVRVWEIRDRAAIPALLTVTN